MIILLQKIISLFSKIISVIIIMFINFYQAAISPLIGGKYKCRFIPTCSEYTKTAIKRFGIIKGCLLGMKRIFKCHPFSKHSGYDPVPKKSKTK